MDEQEFAAHLVSVGWSQEDAAAEAQETFHGSLGDCDGDLGP